MSKVSRYAALFRQAEDADEYWTTIPVVEFSRSLDRLLRTKGISQAALAKRLGCSRAYVSKVLRGDENLSAGTMSKFARTVGGVVHVHCAEREAIVHWFETREGSGKAVPVRFDNPAEKKVDATFSQVSDSTSQAIAF